VASSVLQGLPASTDPPRSIGGRRHHYHPSLNHWSSHHHHHHPSILVSKSPHALTGPPLSDGRARLYGVPDRPGREHIGPVITLLYPS
jgi:hypothetical protein